MVKHNLDQTNMFHTLLYVPIEVEQTFLCIFLALSYQTNKWAMHQLSKSHRDQHLHTELVRDAGCSHVSNIAKTDHEMLIFGWSPHWNNPVDKKMHTAVFIVKVYVSFFSLTQNHWQQSNQNQGSQLRMLDNVSYFTNY